MSDPVEEAVYRAGIINGEYEGGWVYDTADDYAKESAREALAPIRKLHRPDGDYGYMTQCVSCGLMWPCDTARLIYTTTEELNGDS